MNEELLQKIYDQKGFSQFGPFDKFKADMLSSPEMRRKVWEQKGFKEFGDLAKFEHDIGIAPAGGFQPLPKYQKGPVGVARPGVMANPGITDEKLTPFYKVDMDLVKSASAFSGGTAADRIQPNHIVTQELEKQSNIDRENKAAELLNRPEDVLTAAKNMYGTDYNKKKEKFSKDPQIADAEFSFEALGQYRDNAHLVASRSKERLKLMYKDKYSPEQIDKLVGTYTAMNLMGDTEGANKLISQHPELLSDPNANNIFIANQKLRDSAMAELHVMKNNPKWLSRQQKIEGKQRDIDQSVEDYRSQGGITEIAQDILLPGTNALLHPNVGQVLKNKVGTWTKNIAFTPGMRDWGRDKMDFNPKSSDYQGKAIERYKQATIGKNQYDVVYDGDKIEYIRDSKTGFIVKPEDEERKAIEEAASKGELKSRFNPKPFVGQTADVIVDMLPIIAITAATQGAFTGLGLSASLGANVGVVAGSALQMRGDIMDQMLLHPDISNAEAELYTTAIGTGIGLISLFNPIERNLLSKSIPGIAKSNVNKVLNGSMTKGELAWAITKDVGKVLTKEPAEEIVQDWFQYWATKKVDNFEDGIGTFRDNKAPSTDQVIETSLVAATVGLLGGAGSIRRSRSAFTDSALEAALNNPKLVDKYLTDMETGVNGIEDPEKKQEAEEHLARIKGRWESLKANTASVKGLKGDVRGQLATLLVDSNQLESELNGVTNEAIKADKKSQINEINKQIKDLINPPAPTKEAEKTTSTEGTDTPLSEQDVDRTSVDNIDLIEDDGAELDVDYFASGQTVEDENGKGKIVDVNKNLDGTTHSIEIEYDLPDTGRDTYTDDERRPNRTIVIARKSPKEIGVKILSDENRTPGANKSNVTPPSATPDGTGKSTDSEQQPKPTGDAEPSGDSKTPTVKTKSELDPENNPEIKKEIENENKRLSSERNQALIDLADLLSVDPDIDAEPIRNKIEADYAEGVKQINVSSRKNYINKKRDADIKKAKEIGKRRNIDVESTGTLDRIRRAYEDQIAAIEKEYGVADELKNEAAAKKDVIKGDIEAQRDEKLFPRKDYESNPKFQSIKKKYQGSKKKSYGKSVSRTLPSGEKVTGKYVLVNKNDIAASHLPKSFAKTPGVPVTPSGTTFNDNDYETSRTAQATQTRIAKNFDERAIDDIVFIDSNGIVKSGNGRTISRQMSGAENSKSYLDALKARAEEFGFTKEQIEAIGDENVMIAVELEGEPVYNTKEYSKFNATSEKQKTPLQKAIAVAKSIGEKTISLIANVFDQADVMSDLTPKDVQTIKDILLKAGIITELDQSQYFDENTKLTAAGSEFVENIMLSSVFNEDELRMLATMPRLRKKLSLNRVRLLKNSQKGRLSIIPKIRQAIYLINDSRKFEGSYENRLLQQITQGSLLNAAGEIDAESINIALILNSDDMLRKALDKLNGAVETADLFGNTVSSDEIVNFTLETLKADLNEEGKKLLEIAASIPRTEATNVAPAAPVRSDRIDEQTDTKDSERVEPSTPSEETEGEQEVPGIEEADGEIQEDVTEEAVDDTGEQTTPLNTIWDINNDDSLSDDEKISIITEYITPFIAGLSKEMRQHIGSLRNNPNATSEQIANAYAQAEVLGYDELPSDDLIDYVREVIRYNYFDEYIPSIDGHFPNAHGVFDTEIAENFVHERKVKGWQGSPEAAISVLQLADKSWIVAYRFTNHNGDFYGTANPLSIGFKGETFNSREEAITYAAYKIINGHRSQAVKDWAHDIIESVGGQRPDLPPIQDPFFQETNVEQPKPKPEKKKKEKKAPKTIEEKKSEIDKEIDDIWDYFKKQGIAVTPEQQIQDQKMAIRLINLYIQKGYYRIREIMEDMLTKMDKVDAERILPHVKRGYLSAQVDLPDDVVDKMDDRDMVRAMQVDDIQIPTQEENIETDDTQDEEITEPEPEEETVSESEPRDTEAIVADAETVLSQAENASTPEEIRESLNALEAAIEEATSKLGQLVESYDAGDIDHEVPSVVIAKQAKKDITKHAKEIARLTGWEVKNVYANIPPAGGSVNMVFTIPGTPLEMYVQVEYNPTESAPYYDGYTLSGIFYRVEDPTQKGMAQYVGPNRRDFGSFSAKELAQILFQEAKPYMAKRLTSPVEIPATLQAATDLGPLFAAKPTENSPIFDGKSTSNAKPRPNKRTRNSGRKLDQPHQGFQQGLLFGTEPEGDTTPGSLEEGAGVRSGGGEIEGDREVSTGGRGGSGQNVPVPRTLPIEDARKEEAAAQPAHNFHFPNNYTEPTSFSQPQRFKDNLDALKTLATLLRSNRDALPDEQTTLSKYVGWGGIKVILNNESTQWTDSDEKMRPMVAELKELIDVFEKELGFKNVLRGIKGSVLNAHYTSIPIIRSMYSILYRMGFTGGAILEPSAGIGNFLGAIPGIMAQNSKLHAVELEQLTGSILKKLYPKAMNTIGGYETMNYPSNNFDLAISNVPFGTYRIYTEPNASPVLKKAGAAIHNYFFVRALEQVKEGGLIAFITTAGTLDSKGNKFVREHLNENTDFLGAIRLPSNAFQGNAGTQVVTDIIFLRKNTTGEKNNPEFVNTHPLQVQHKNNGKNITIEVNEYFVSNPDHVIGEFMAGGQYSETDMTVVAPKGLDVADEILKLESKFPTDVFNPQNATHSTDTKIDEDQEFVPDFKYYIGPDGKAAINKDGEPMSVPKTHAPKVPALIALRDTLRKQYDLELYSDSESAIEANRKQLSEQYDAFVKKNGFLNAQKNKPFISRDDFGYNILSLEIWDKKENKAKKSDILSKRSLNRIRRAESAESFEDAIAISVNETAKVDLHRIAELMGLQPEQVFEQAYGLFFKDTNGNVVERGEYLSGNVKHKLMLAKEMAEVDPLFAKNVEELEKVIPEDIPYTLIDVNLGSRWIPTEYYAEFLNKTLETSGVSVAYSRAADLYKVDGPQNANSTTKYGTGRMNAYELMASAMQGRAPVVKDLVDPGPPKKYVVNQAETQAARDKLVDLVNAFEEWIFSDHARAKKLEKIYNELFNTSIKRSFDGTNFHVDGLKDITLMEHQKSAASMLFLNNGGIVDHIVGAGKTYTMIAAAMKMKQTGVANKPTIIALKSTIPQIVADAKKVFPSARILAPTEADFKSKNRKALLARIQNNDWDLVIMSHEQFKFIPQDPEFESNLILEEIEAIEKEVEMIIAESGKENKRLRTALESRIKSLVERLEKVQNKGTKDTELMTFKEIGIDHLFVDESQQFKNLPYATKISNVAGLGTPKGSSRAFNLLTAVRTLQALHGGDKGTTFLSGTPISNSLVEMYLLLKYLRPTRMKELGYDTFDSWSKNAAKQTDEMEFSVTGTIKSKTRFRTFVNIPEVVGLYTEIADVRNENNLTLPRPTVKGGEPILVTVPQNEEQEEWTARLIEFASQKHGERDGRLIGKGDLDDKQQTAAMLLVTNISTKLSVDLRLVDPKASFNPNGKLAAVSKNVYKEYVDSSAIKGTQLVFCDVGTPKSGKIKEDLRDFLQDERGVIDDDLNVIFGDPENPKKQTLDDIRAAMIEHLEYTESEADEAIEEARAFSPFNAYDEVKRLLVQQGIPEDEIAFIHSYKTENAKKKLFDDVNDGKIRVVLGSTQKLGTGVNVQKRAVAAHHIDASWNPASMTQRNGRVIRQGNMNEEVSIYNYGTELTLDAYKYQLIYTKQKFIDQVKTGASGERTYKEGEGEDMSSQKIVALLSGNPLLLEKEKIDSQADKLKRAKRAYDNEQYQIKNKISESSDGITSLTAAIKNREDDLAVVKANSKVVTEEQKVLREAITDWDIEKLKADPQNSNFEVKTLKRPGSNEKAEFLVYNKSRLEPDVVIRGKVPKDSEERNKWMTEIGNELKRKFGMSLGGQEIIGKAGGLDIIGKVKAEKGDFDAKSRQNAYTLVVNFFLSGQFEYATSPSTFSPAVNKIEPDIEKAKAALQERKENLVKLKELDGQPWPKQAEYEAALAKQKEIEAQLRAQEKAVNNEQDVEEFSEDDEISFSLQDVTEDDKFINEFYSPLYNTVSTAKAEKMPVKHWIEKFASSEEARWTGLQEWLRKQDGSVTKSEILEYLNENRIQIVEEVKSDETNPFTGRTKAEMMEDLRNEIRTYGYDLEYEMGGEWMPMKDGEMIEDEDMENVPIEVQNLMNQHYELDMQSGDEAEGNTQYKGYTLDGEKSNYREILVTLPNNKATPHDFKGPHWSEKNVLVHLRADTRIDENGDTVLFIEEMQSDWAQTGRKKGFVYKEDQWAFDFAEKIYNIKNLYNLEVYSKDEANMKLAAIREEALDNGVSESMIQDALAKYGDFTVSRPSGQPVAPFVTDTNAWTKLGLKVALRHAVNLGATKIAWTTGEQQSDRYDLSHQISLVSASAAKEPGLYNLVIEDKQGQELLEYRGSGKSVTPEEMRETIGEELANKLMAGADQRKGTPWKPGTGTNPEFYTIKGIDLKIGGDGMQGYYGNPEENILGIIGNVAKSMFGYVTTTQIDTGKAPTTQHSISITPTIRSTVIKQGIPLFSLAAQNEAQDAINSGNQNPNAPIIIKLRDANATPEERLQQYAGVWLDVIERRASAFYNRGLELIKGTEYAKDHPDERTALAAAIGDHAAKLPKDHKLITWVKQFWQKVGKILRLNIEPDQLRELTIGQYLDIAATQLRYGNDIYAELVADGAQVTDSEQAQVYGPGPKKPVAERQKAIEKEFEEQAESVPKPEPKPTPKPRIEPPIPVDKEFEFDSRDLNATGTVFTSPKSPEADRLLREYSGAKKRLIETVFLLFPTLKNAGISLTLHENPDSYYNAVVKHHGTPYQAVTSGGFYRAKEIHINLSKPDLKENTALHEAFHPIIREILVNDKPTFQRFLKDIMSDPDMKKKYHDNFAQRYAHMQDPNLIAEEILVEASADTVMKRILESMDPKDLPESLFDRIITYIKKALGDTYGQLIQFVNTKDSFASFANTMADAISKGMAVALNPDIEGEIRTIVNDSIQLSQDSDVSLLSQVFSQKGLVNHEKVKRIAKQVVEGTARIRRLNSAEEQGRIAGGKRNVELSILLGASQRAGTKPEQSLSAKQSENESQIRLIKDYASKQGFLVPLSKIESTYTFLDDGAEADVYIDEIADYVLKVVKINPFGQETPLKFLDDRISLHNYLFPDTKYELVGIANDDKYLYYMLRQPFIQVTGRPTATQLERYMKEHFMATMNMNTGSPETSFINSNYIIEDLHFKNVLVYKSSWRGDTTLHFIDTFSRLNTPEEGHGGSRQYEDFDIVQNVPFEMNAQFSMQSEEEQRRESIKANLKHKILTNPDVNFEPIADNLVKKGILSKEEANDILQGWRQARARSLNPDQTIAAIENMAELLHLRKMDEADNLQVNNANMQRFIEDYDANMEDILDRYSAFTLKNLVEEVASSGLAHPSTVLQKLHELNDQNNPTAAGPKLTIAISIAFAELEKSRNIYAKIVEETGSEDASEQVQYIDNFIYRLANAAKVNGSIAGASLGIRSKLLQLAGLTYQSQLAQLELLNKSKAGKDIEVAEADKKEIKRLVNEINALQEALDKALLSANPIKNKQIAAQNAFNSKIRSSLEARPTLSKQEALELLKRMRAMRASFSLSLSLDEPEYTYFDIINELVKIAHEEGVKGFKEVVNKVMGYDSSIKEDDIYNAILSTTTHAQQKARSEYAKRQAITRKHVKDINNVETMLTKQVTDLLRRQKMPDEKDINEFGNLIKEIEKNIYQMDASTELVTQWANALEAIRTNYAFAFLSPTPSESTDAMLSKVINAVRILKDQKFHQWLESKNKQLDQELALINAGRVSELIEDDDIAHRSLPNEMVVPVFNDEGEIIGDKIIPYNFGAMDRLIRDKKSEIERVKAKYRKRTAVDKLKWWHNVAKGTLGSAMAMADLSYFAIQGFRMFATYGLRNPRTFFHAFGSSLRTMRDEFRKNPGLSNEIYRQITEHPFYERAVALGLVITSPDSHIFVNEMLGEEDAFDIAHGKTAGRKNYLARSARLVLGARRKLKMASNAAFATHLNLLSMNTFANYIQKVREATGEDPSNEELVAMAREINNSTGRTTRLKEGLKYASYVFWAPRLYLSQILNLANIIGDPANYIYHKSKGNKEMARAYGHRTVNSAIFAATAAGLYMLRKFLAKKQCGDNTEVSMDPHKTSFLKIKCGELTYDPTGNERQWLALGARILAGSDGEPIVDFYGKPVGTPKQIVNMLEYKWNPLLSTGFQLWDAADFLGRPRFPDDQSAYKWKSRAQIMLDHMAPISTSNIVGIARAKGVAPVSKPFTMAEAVLGFGVNYIDSEKEAERKAIEKEVRARKKQEGNTKGVKSLEKRFGAIKELQGRFKSTIPAESLEPTSKKISDSSGTYRVFKRTDDPDGNGIQDDFYIIKTTKTGANKGLKYLEKISDNDKIR